MKTAIIMAAMLAWAAPTFVSAQDSTIRDPQGRILWSDSTRGDVTTRRDDTGRVINTEQDSGGVRVIRDPQGRIVRTEREY